MSMSPAIRRKKAHQKLTDEQHAAVRWLLVTACVA